MTRLKLFNLPGKNWRHHSIGVRFRNSNVLIILSALIAVTIVVVILVNGITEKTSKRYAQLYSVETVEKFDLHLSKELDLMNKIAHSKELIRWFADEDNIPKKTEAYEKLMGYADMMFGNDFYFGIEGSLHEYTINQDTPFSIFAIWIGVRCDSTGDAALIRENGCLNLRLD